MNRRRSLWLFLPFLLSLTCAAAPAYGADSPAEERRPPHPEIRLLDANGDNVADSGLPVSTMQTCGQCHDTGYIERHDFHSGLGLPDLVPEGEAPSGRPWDTGPGWFGRWNPIVYRYLTPPGDLLLDLGTADWVRVWGVRHAGGGPAVRSRDGDSLTSLTAQDTDPETHVLGPDGAVQTWDWATSGVVELNCFLCHIESPDNEARIAELQRGDFAWANTATLASRTLVSRTDDGMWVWNPGAFDSYGRASHLYLQVQQATDDNCGLCHGVVSEGDEPLDRQATSIGDWQTLTSGQVFSPQTIAESALNIDAKSTLTLPWDVHAGIVGCADCHHAPNNPTIQGTGFLTGDAETRSVDLYLLRPDHLLTHGVGASGSVAATAGQTFKGCRSCHDQEDLASHADWLPEADFHLNRLACQTCHVPKLYQPAAEQYDWTVIHTDGSPKSIQRGVQLDAAETPLITGYQPVVLEAEQADGERRLAPFNLVSAWFWVYGDPPRPVRELDLRRAFLEGDRYRPEIVRVFDENQDGSVSEGELAIDSPEKEQVVRAALEGLGLSDVHIQAELQPYDVSHGVVTHRWATQTCDTCHGPESVLTSPMQVAAYVPGGVLPQFLADTTTETDGALATHGDGSLWYEPALATRGMATLVKSSASDWVGQVGLILTLLVLLWILIHALMRVTLRFELRYRLGAAAAHGKEVSRWYQVELAGILLLAVTGLLIQVSGDLGGGIRGLSLLHTVSAAALLADGLVVVAWNLGGERTRLVLPHLDGYVDLAVRQIGYYTYGVRHGAEHPLGPNPSMGRQILSVAVLDMLVPAVVVTGALMWAADLWPRLVATLHGLPVLTPLHALLGWLVIAGTALDAYINTPGTTPLAVLREQLAEADPIYRRETV